VTVVAGFEGFGDLGLRAAHLGGDLGDRRFAVETAGQVRDDDVDLPDPVIEASGQSHRRGAVAEVPLQFAGDGGGSEGDERDATCGVETIDRVDQSEARNLDQVVEGFRLAAVADGDALGESEVAVDQLLAGMGVAVAALPEIGLVGQSDDVACRIHPVLNLAFHRSASLSGGVPLLSCCPGALDPRAVQWCLIVRGNRKQGSVNCPVSKT